MPLVDAMNSAASAAASQVASVAADKILTALLSEAKLDNDAQQAIKLITNAITDVDEKFVNLLKRDDFGSSIKQWFSNQVFNPNKVALYLYKHQTVSTANLTRPTDKNLRKAVDALSSFQSDAALHFNYRVGELTGDSDYSHVLLFLHLFVSELTKKLSKEKDDVGDDQLTNYQGQLKKCEDAFSEYVKKTKTKATSAARRIAMLGFLSKMKDEVHNSLELSKASRTLRSRISGLRQKLEDFSIQLQRVLFAIILEPGNGAAEQLKESTQAEHSNKMLFLEKLLGASDKNALLLMDEKQCLGYKTMLHDRAVGTIYVNPFFNRARELANGYEKSVQKKILPTKKQLFYNVWLEVINARNKRLTSNTVYKKIAEFAHRYNDEKLAKSKFSMLQIPKDKAVLLKSEVNAGLFLQRTMALFHQSNELANFLNALNGFMETVGKIGIYSNESLHKILQEIINKAQDEFKQNFDAIKECINDGERSICGAWLDELMLWFKEIKENGKNIKTDMDNFKSEFACISDKEKMEDEFEQKKNELLEAAVGIVDACGVDKNKIKQLVTLIGGKKLEQFVAAPIPTSSKVLEHHQRNMEGLILHNIATEKQNNELAAQLKQAEGSAADAKKEIGNLRDLNEKQQALIVQIQGKIKDKDDAVIAFVNDLKIKLLAQQKRNGESIGKFEGLKHEIINTPTPTADVQKLTEARSLIKELQATKAATDELLGEVNKFGAKYAVHSQEVNNKLQELKAITDDMHNKINALEDKINFLEKIVKDLNAKIADYQTKMQKLEKEIQDAKLAAYKKAIKEYPTHMFEHYLNIHKDAKLSVPEKAELLALIPDIVKALSPDPDAKPDTNNQYSLDGEFTISCKLSESDSFERTLYVPWEVAGWVNSSSSPNPGESGRFKLKLCDGGKYFEIVSQAYFQYPLFVCEDPVGGLICSTRKPGEFDAAEKLFGTQKQITLKPHKGSDGSYHFIMSSMRWPKSTLYLESRWDGRVKSYSGDDPGVQGYFKFTQVSPGQPVKPQMTGEGSVVELMANCGSPVISAPPRNNPSGVNLNNCNTGNLPAPQPK